MTCGFGANSAGSSGAGLRPGPRDQFSLTLRHKPRASLQNGLLRQIEADGPRRHYCRCSQVHQLDAAAVFSKRNRRS